MVGHGERVGGEADVAVELGFEVAGQAVAGCAVAEGKCEADVAGVVGVGAGCGWGGGGCRSGTRR